MTTTRTEVKPVATAPADPSTDYNAAAEHIRLLAGAAKTPMHFRLFPDKKTAGDTGRDLYGTLADCWPEMQEWQGQGYGVFVIPNAGGGNDASITSVRALFIDMDDRTRPEKWHVAPDFFVDRDATHWHAYWLVADCAVPEFKTAQKRLAAYYGSDPRVCNPSRVMRLAGTIHQKVPSNPRLVTIEDNSLMGSGDPHTLAELMAGLPDVAPPAEPRTLAADYEEDKPAAIEQFRQRVMNKPAPAEGEGSDEACYKAIAYGRDLGLSEQRILELMVEWTGFDEDWLYSKFENAGRYKQNPDGSNVPESTVEKFGPFAENMSAQGIVEREIPEIARRYIEASRILAAHPDDPELRRFAAKLEWRGPAIVSDDGFPDLTPFTDETPFTFNAEGQIDWQTWFAAIKPGFDIEAEKDRQTGIATEIVARGRVLHDAEKPTKDDVDEWMPHEPRDPASMPAIEHFDTDKMIPKIPEGAIGILYGRRGEHKTNTILSMLDTSSAKRILYAAGEGAYGVERDRISARAGLKGRIRILPRVPLFSSTDQVDKFIAGANRAGFRPEIVVLDTMATVLAGEDEQSSQVASLLTDNGPAGRIKRAWNCTVILIAHAGKDIKKGVRGSSGFEGNVDFLILVEADKKAGAIKATCEKMRDGVDGHEVHYRVELSGVPVPVKITDREYHQLAGDKEKLAAEAAAQSVERTLKWLLLHNGYGPTWAEGCEDKELARLWTEHAMGGPRPGETGHDGVAEWDDKFDECLKATQNAANRTRRWTEGHVEAKRPRGGEIKIRRWFNPAVGEEILM